MIKTRMKDFIIPSFIHRIPLKTPWRRCPLIRQKVQIQKALRVSSVIQNRVQKNQGEFFLKSIETVINTELPFLPFLKNFEELYLINELILFFLYRDDFRKIKDQKYQLNITICFLQILMKRFLIPFFIKLFLYYLNNIENK